MSHLSNNPWGLKQKCTQFLTPFSGTKITQKKKLVSDQRRINSTEEMYLVDSGGQYKDGTTDVTRTVHLGNPTRFQQECFTRVLKGQIRLATMKFPNKCIGSRLDAVARYKH